MSVNEEYEDHENEDDELDEELELVKIHEEAINDFNSIQSVARDGRLQSLQDRRFYSIAGAQWEGDWGKQFENRPKLEINKIHMSIMRIFSEYRQNRITVNFTSKDGVVNTSLADTCDGLYRADENDSQAEEAYDNAFEEGVGGGFGAWRLRADYEDEYDDENEYQRIRIEPIYDADSLVFFDLDAKRFDKSDAKYCYVLTPMTIDAYKAEYNDDPTSWDKSINSNQFDWVSPDVVYLAEYYKVESYTHTVYIYRDLQGEEERYTEDQLQDPELVYELEAKGSKEVRQKKVKRKRVHKYIMSGAKILEDCGYIAGTEIPIVPYFGKRWFVDNVERFMGHVRLAKDSQLLSNIQFSKLAEISTLSPVEKPIFTPEQIAGHQMMWSEDNVKNFPYALVNPITDQSGNVQATGPLGYTKPPQIPPALAALTQMTDAGLQEVLGNQQAAEQITSNIAEGTVELIHDKLDLQTYIYMSNFAKSVKRSGEIWLSMAKDIFVESGRRMKTIGNGGEVSSIELMQDKMNSEGKVEVTNDLSKAKFDVNVEVGPASTTKRKATVRSIINMLPLVADPAANQVLASTAIMNMEGEGLQDIRDYFRQQLIRMGAAQPTEEEIKQMQEEMESQQPTPQDQYLMAEAANAEAKAQKAQADTVKAVADAEKIKAQTAEIIAGINREDRESAVKGAQALIDMLSTQ